MSLISMLIIICVFALFPFALLAICAYVEYLILVRVKRRTFPWPSLLPIPVVSGFILWRYILISPTSLNFLNVGFGRLYSVAALAGSVIGFVLGYCNDKRSKKDSRELNSRESLLTRPVSGGCAGPPSTGRPYT